MIQFFLDFKKIILENIQQSKKNEKRTEIKILGEFLKQNSLTSQEKPSKGISWES